MLILELAKLGWSPTRPNLSRCHIVIVIATHTKAHILEQLGMQMLALRQGAEYVLCRSSIDGLKAPTGAKRPSENSCMQVLRISLSTVADCRLPNNTRSDKDAKAQTPNPILDQSVHAQSFGYSQSTQVLACLSQLKRNKTLCRGPSCSTTKSTWLCGPGHHPFLRSCAPVLRGFVGMPQGGLGRHQ